MNKHVHFTGIGGIGMSGLAQYYLSQGFEVSGSDLRSSEIIDFLKEKGMDIYLGKQTGKGILKNTQMVVFSPAIKKNNKDLIKAKKLGIRVLSYPQALGKLTKKYFSICVSGTHGKSTTTSMLYFALKQGGLDPTVIVGTKLKEFNNSNFKKGKSKFLLIEADEYKDSFLNYSPNVIVLTNIEADHLDYFKNLKGVLRSFKTYLSQIEKNGFLIVNEKDQNIKKIIKNKKYFNFHNIETDYKKEIKKNLKVPGHHNFLNALAAFKTAQVLGLKSKDIIKGLSQFNGCWRRFEKRKIKINKNAKDLIFDYGHHPTEILATCKTIREEFKNKKIKLIFQPHQYQRTKLLFNDFVKTFKVISKNLIDKIFITDIFDVAGRETLKKEIDSKKLVKSINHTNVFYLKGENICKNIKNTKEDVILIMGAGDIYERVLKIFKEKFL
ncbi:MAG TPA: UDP-N-acetylmuramate--L-alanine ligase [Patescibacteria group bacterium]|nr:UDP-N-acetylmuramate--L-alanine ligase [Patescibacteria group bacterium]